MQSGSVNVEEVKKFDALAARWWDPSGPMRPLHMMNPVRVKWILNQISRRLTVMPAVIPAKAGTGIHSPNILDIGCGAGLLSESLAKAGHTVLGLDAATEAIEAAQSHAANRNLPVTYRAGSAEDLVAEGQKFPVITALEVIEHVDDPAGFIATLASLLEPGGMLFISTLNRTARSYLTAKLGAEYLLRLLPAGTHDWKQFITPAELDDYCRRAGLRLSAIAGISFSPLRGFHTSRDTKINYIAAAISEN